VVVVVVFPEADFRRRVDFPQVAFHHQVGFRQADFHPVDSLLAPVEDLAARLISRQVARVIFRPAVTSPIRPSRARPAEAVATAFKTTGRECSSAFKSTTS
jgi:hypothetical protein